jgi:hypothetical protein
MDIPDPKSGGVPDPIPYSRSAEDVLKLVNAFMKIDAQNERDMVISFAEMLSTGSGDVNSV